LILACISIKINWNVTNISCILKSYEFHSSSKIFRCHDYGNRMRKQARAVNVWQVVTLTKLRTPSTFFLFSVRCCSICVLITLKSIKHWFSNVYTGCIRLPLTIPFTFTYIYLCDLILNPQSAIYLMLF